MSDFKKKRKNFFECFITTTHDFFSATSIASVASIASIASIAFVVVILLWNVFDPFKLNISLCYEENSFSLIGTLA